MADLGVDTVSGMAIGMVNAEVVDKVVHRLLPVEAQHSRPSYLVSVHCRPMTVLPDQPSRVYRGDCC